jgi:hypothetical protein
VENSILVEIIESKLKDIIAQMGKMNRVIGECQTRIDRLVSIVGPIANKWAPEIERVSDEHARDIDAIKGSQEHIGKTIVSLKHDIADLKSNKSHKNG